MDQEIILKATIAEQQAHQLEENLQLVDAQITELEEFNRNLKTLRDSKEKEMLSQLGKRVYIKTKIENKEKLFVEVGAGVVVKKTPEETMKIVSNQISRLQEAKVQILSQLNFYHTQLQEFLETVRK